MYARFIPFALASSVLLALGGISHGEDNDDSISASKVQQGFDISPVPKAKLNLAGKDAARVGLGSYIVNAVDGCSGCHTFPQYLEKGDPAGSNPTAGDPFQGTPSTQGFSRRLVANYNVSHYLAGGRCFGPGLMSFNLTPEATGRPLGLTEAEFIKVMRTGEDIHCEKSPSDPICTLGPDTPLLQVMPWPNFHNMSDTDLKAIYAYLTALPPAEACNTPADGCPGFSGAAANSQSYVYPNTDDCPNPAPPQ
jgi:hypothetical protein